MRSLTILNLPSKQTLFKSITSKGVFGYHTLLEVVGLINAGDAEKKDTSV